MSPWATLYKVALHHPRLHIMCHVLLSSGRSTFWPDMYQPTASALLVWLVTQTMRAFANQNYIARPLTCRRRTVKLAAARPLRQVNLRALLYFKRSAMMCSRALGRSVSELPVTGAAAEVSAAAGAGGVDAARG